MLAERTGDSFLHPTQKSKEWKRQRKPKDCRMEWTTGLSGLKHQGRALACENEPLRREEVATNRSNRTVMIFHGVFSDYRIVVQRLA